MFIKLLQILSRVDNSLLVYFSEFGKIAILNSIAQFFHFELVVIVLIFSIGYLYLRKDIKNSLIWLEVRREVSFFVTLALAYATTSILKLVILRPRPFTQLIEKTSELSQLSASALDSFPSGHSTFFMALAILMFHYDRRLGWVFLILALLVGLSRLVLAVHYPSDVLAGWLIGALVVQLTFVHFRKQKNKLKNPN